MAAALATPNPVGGAFVSSGSRVAQPAVRGAVADTFLAAAPSESHVGSKVKLVAAVAALTAGHAIVRRGVEAQHRASSRRHASSSGDGAAAAVTADVPAVKPIPVPFFDPLGFCKTQESYTNAKSVEMAIGRMAMLGAVGVPLSELYHEQFADAAGLPSKLPPSGIAPSVLMGGDFGPVPEATVVGVLAAIFLVGFGPRSSGSASSGTVLDSILNPKPMRESSLSPMLMSMLSEAQAWNGRLAMIAITAIALQEAATGVPVVDFAPFLFGGGRA